jgi:hypothetical protein
MRKHFGAIIAIGLLIFVALACNASFTTAKINSLNFGKNETATPPSTTFDVNEKAYAVVDVGGISKQKVSFKITYENVQGKGKGEEALKKEVDLPGAGTANLYFTTPLPGEYKIEATLLDDSGKEVDKKSGTVTMKGNAAAPPTSADTTKDDKKKDDDDDK